MTKKAVRISSELHVILHALDAVGLLLQQWAELHFSGDEGRRVAPAAHAPIVLLRERVRLLERVVRDTVDLRLLLTSENRGHDQLPDDDGNVVLPAWSVGTTEEKAREEAGRSARRLRAIRERGRTKKRTREEVGDP